MIDKGYEPKGHNDPTVVAAINEACARAEAAQKLALFAIAQLMHLQQGDKRPVDLLAFADELERRGAGQSEGEQRSRLIAAGLLRALADPHPDQT